MACKVKVNQHGFLAFHLFWNRTRSWEGTGLRDTPENREFVKAQAVIMSREIKKRKFNYLKWFPEGNKADQFRPKKEEPMTVGKFYREWIERKKPPVVRKGLERDYREQFNRYILPKFESINLSEVSPPRLEDFRAHLLQERGLSLKSCRNIMDATFRAMVRDARRVDYLIEKDPFGVLQWPRAKPQKPDPFTEEERDKILTQFKVKNPFYYPFLFTLFWTGMRPSEAIALRWGDVDLKRERVSITKSRYLKEENTPKTAGSNREASLLPNVVEVLRALKPIHVTEADYVFRNQEGNPINFPTWRKNNWYRMLRATGIRERKPYTTRHTYISVALSVGVNLKWLAEQCGTSVTMIEKHYGKYVRNDGDAPLRGPLGAKSETLGETFDNETPPERVQVVVNSKKEVKWAHLDSNQGPTGYEPVALTS